MKSWWCFLTDCLSNPSILLKILRISNSQLKFKYLKKPKVFSQLFVPFVESTSILNILKKWMIVIANEFSKLETVKILLRHLSKSCCYRTRFDSQYVKASQIILKSPWERFSHVFSSFSGKLIWKMSPLVLGEILLVFFNKLTPNFK